MKHLKNRMTDMTSYKRITVLFIATLLFSLGYLAGGAKQTDSGSAAVTAQENIPDTVSPFQRTKISFVSQFDHAKITDAKMHAATEKNIAAVIRSLPGIADAIVISRKRPDWKRSRWSPRPTWYADVVLDSTDNQPINADTIETVGRIVAASFGITNLEDISIVDARNSLHYDGSGERQNTAQVRRLTND